MANSERYKAPEVWFFFAISSVLLCWYSTHAIRTLLDVNGDPYKVFGSFWISGWAALHHLNPYGIYPQTWHFHAFTHARGPMIYDVNLSPPCLLPIFQVLSHFTLRDGVLVWTALSVMSFVLGVALLIAGRGIQKRQVVWLLLSQAIFETLWLGQDYSFMFLLACIACCFIRSGRMIPAAICIGVLVAIKPNLGLCPVMLLLAGHKRVAIVAASIAAGLSLLPALIYGPSVYLQWLRTHSHVQHFIFPTDISIAGFCARLGSYTVGILLAVFIAFALMVFVYRQRPNLLDVCGIAICAGILCSPLAWYEYTILAAPFFVISRRWARLEMWAAAPLFFFPDFLSVVVMGHNRFLVELTGIPYLLAVCLMLASFMRSASRARRSQSQRAPELVSA